MDIIGIYVIQLYFIASMIDHLVSVHSSGEDSVCQIKYVADIFGKYGIIWILSDRIQNVRVSLLPPGLRSVPILSMAIQDYSI